MGKIIALRGRARCGKTPTIRLLPAILLANGYQQITGTIPPHIDFSAIFERGGIKVGVTSTGDTYDYVFDALSSFVNAGCDVCICACRTSDRKPLGTNAAVNSFPSHPAQFVPKTIVSPSFQEAAANAADANTIFSLI